MILSFTVPGCPQPKQRARRGADGHWHTPQRTRSFEAKVLWYACGALVVAGNRALRPGETRPSGFAAWRVDGEYHVTIGVFFPDRRRRDADNVAKGVLDALNPRRARGKRPGTAPVVWKDDSQVRRLTVTTEVDQARPRTEVTIELLQPKEATDGKAAE